jgi:hypothetical protein
MTDEDWKELETVASGCEAGYDLRARMELFAKAILETRKVQERMGERIAGSFNNLWGRINRLRISG